MKKACLYLTERNLLVLQSKLARKLTGEQTSCTIVKRDNTHALYPQSQERTTVTSVVSLPDVVPQNTLYMLGTDLSMMLEELQHRLPLANVTTYDIGKYTVYTMNDNEYYATRSAGEMHPRDTPLLKAA